MHQEQRIHWNDPKAPEGYTGWRLFMYDVPGQKVFYLGSVEDALSDAIRITDMAQSLHFTLRWVENHD